MGPKLSQALATSPGNSPVAELIFDNVTGDMPQKKPRTLLLDPSPGANRLRQSTPHSMTTLHKTQPSGAPDQGNWETVIKVTSEATSLRSLSSDVHGAQVHLTLEKTQPKLDTEQTTREPEPSSAISTRNPHPKRIATQTPHFLPTRRQRPNRVKLQHRSIGSHLTSLPIRRS